ncbi:MAG: prolipoprotein diacylglyceryl transferase [Verrucomicrobiota bacterium]
MLATYIHDLDPVLISFTEVLKVRWYGLAYLAGFLAGWAILKKMARDQLFPLPPDKVSDFIAYGAFLGVFLGGRLGYVLFYMLPSEAGRAKIAEDPLTIIKVWDGGMASHGGILGLTIFAWFYAKRAGVRWTALGDGLVTVAPLGVFFGRLANFINGELYGRPASDSLPWAVKFPKTLFDNRLTNAEFADQSAALRIANTINPNASQDLVTAARENPAIETAIEPFLLARHPSQLYQGLVEGLLLFLLLLFLAYRHRNLPTGTRTGLFFLLYAFGRIIVENFREPDSALIGPLTKGQFYSTFFILIGFVFLLYAWKKKPPPPAPQTNRS